MKWLDLVLNVLWFFAMFLLILLIEPSAQPIVEVALGAILLSINLWFSLPKSLENQVAYSPNILRRLGFVYLVSILIMTYWLPLSFLFWPVFSYTWTNQKLKDQMMFFLPIVFGGVLGYSVEMVLFVTCLCVLASWTHTILAQSQAFEVSSYHEIDTLRHLNERFSVEQQSLIKLQDERVKETLRLEKRRSVEDIHDLLGHQLSSVVIQIAALEYIVEEAEAKQALHQIKEVLTTSMDNVRQVIHTERQATVHLENELQTLVDNFTKCPINFQFKQQCAMNSQTAHSIVNIVKEALTNINKHAGATLVTLRLLEMDQQWTLLIADNGKTSKPATIENLVVNEIQNNTSGIGLLTIEKRVQQLGGSLHINQQNGFRIFITIPIPQEEAINDENTAH